MTQAELSLLFRELGQVGLPGFPVSAFLLDSLPDLLEITGKNRGARKNDGQQNDKSRKDTLSRINLLS